MKIRGTAVPQAAIDAGRGAMADRFRIEDVRGAVAASLRDHADGPAFDYGAADPAAFDTAVAARLLQDAKHARAVRHLGGGEWEAVGS